MAILNEGKDFFKNGAEPLNTFCVINPLERNKGEIYMETQTKAEQTFSRLIKGDTPVLVDFYTEWCGPCKMMIPILKKLKNRMGDNINIIKIDAEKNPAVAIRYQIKGVPTLILFNKGQVLWQTSGVVREEQLHSIITSRVNLKD